MVPKYAIAGPHTHYSEINALAPEHPTGGLQKSEYSVVGEHRRLRTCSAAGVPSCG